jgi:ribonuclease H / adenosylcobalamin/alpha-ribazole phosphatase
MKAIVFFDGGCAPKNPGHAAFAVVVKLGKKRHVLSRYIGIHTNNYAEYSGLIVAVKYAKELGAQSIEIYSDSQLVVNQVNGKWKIKNSDIRTLAVQAQDLLKRHYPMAWELKWIPREKNALADYYCTLAINHGRNRNPWLKKKRPEKIVDEFSAAGRV